MKKSKFHITLLVWIVGSVNWLAGWFVSSYIKHAHSINCGRRDKINSTTDVGNGGYGIHKITWHKHIHTKRHNIVTCFWLLG
jgi:hypothetical protein